MAKQRIDAIIIQKIATQAEWNNIGRVPEKGEFMLIQNSVSQPVNLKIGDGNRAFSALPNFIQYDQAAYVAPVGNTLPVPSNNVGYSLLTEGSYNSGALVVPTGSIGKAEYIGNAWVLTNMPLPATPVTDELGTSTTTSASQRLVTEVSDSIDTKIYNAIDNGEIINLPFIEVTPSLAYINQARIDIVNGAPVIEVSPVFQVWRIPCNTGDIIKFHGNTTIGSTSPSNPFPVILQYSQSDEYVSTIGSSTTPNNNAVPIDITATAESDGFFYVNVRTDGAAGAQNKAEISEFILKKVVQTTDIDVEGLNEITNQFNSGKVLSDNNYTDSDKDKISSFDIVNLFESLRKQQRIQNEVRLNRELITEGFRFFRNTSTADGNSFVNYLLDEGVYWVEGHRYYVAFDMLVAQDSLTEGGGSESGNFYGLVRAKYNDPNNLGTATIRQNVVVGTRGLHKSELTVNSLANTFPNSQILFFQFGNYALGQTVDLSIYKSIVIDLTVNNLTWDEADQLVSEFGMIDSKNAVSFSKESSTSAYATVAGSVESMNIGSTIEVWGDSLVAQGWGTNMGIILGRNVLNRGYGGRTSTFIRDQFLASQGVKTRPQIICVGRNNYTRYETVIDDIRAMVKHMGHQNYLILMPPNGGYGNPASLGGELREMKGGVQYGYFIDLQQRLAKEYAANFLDSREGTIYSYDNGGVRLSAAFTQPSIGSNVQINVSSTAFLTTYNQTDLGNWGSPFMSKIVIGGIDNKYDVYTVISVQSDTLMTVRLDTVGRVSAGGTVQNMPDNGDSPAIQYLIVMQNADYECFINDTTQSTGRTDAIHMSPRYIQCLAEVVARKINTMKI